MKVIPETCRVHTKLDIYRFNKLLCSYSILRFAYILSEMSIRICLYKIYLKRHSKKYLNFASN